MEKNKNALGKRNELNTTEAGEPCGCLKLSSLSRCLGVFFQQIQVNQHLCYNIYNMYAFINYAIWD